MSGTESRRAKAAEKTAAVHDASRDLALQKIPAGFGLRLSFLPLLPRRFSATDTFNRTTRDF